MKILAIDTATEACSAALYWDGQVLENFVTNSKAHGSLLLGMMDGLLKQAGAKLVDLDALAFGRGPGAFTGVRIAVATAQAIGFGVGLPLIPISNLAILAQGAYRERGSSRVLAALDARMEEIYLAGYEILAKTAREIIPEQVTASHTLSLVMEGDWHGVGKGWTAHNKALELRYGHMVLSVDQERLCQAQDLFPLAIKALKDGQVVPPDLVQPVYLRNQVTWKSSKNQ